MLTCESIRQLLYLLAASAVCGSNQESWMPGNKNSVSIVVGRDAVLSCKVPSHHNNSLVSWIKEEDNTVLNLHNRTLTGNNRIAVSSNGSTWHLHFRNIKESDRGCYACKVNMFPISNDISCIDVLVSPEIDVMATSNDTTVDEGETVKLTCKARGNPQPKISWVREDHQLIHEGPSFNGSVLTLDHVERSYGGNFVCIAENGVPPAFTKNVLMTVNFRPEVRFEEASIGSVEDRDIRLVCFCYASPRPQIYWLFNDSIISHSHKHSFDREELDISVSSGLRLRPVGPGDFGYYSCLCKNELGRHVASIKLYRIDKPPPIAVPVPSTNTLASDKENGAAVTDINDNSLNSMVSAKDSTMQVTPLESSLVHKLNHGSSCSQLLASCTYVLLTILLNLQF